jgi:hypothetical protein
VNLSIFTGGSGGGGGGSCVVFCSSAGALGGDGGGALYFGTSGDFTVTGAISASGWAGVHAGGDWDGAGGGGAGGYLWFGTSGTWTNDGVISAQGGAGGASAAGNGGGYGSGGYIVIDPSQIVNNGIIDVRNGNGGNGGLVTLDGLLSGSGVIEGSLAPEPGTFLLVAIPLAVLAVRRRRLLRP